MEGDKVRKLVLLLMAGFAVQRCAASEFWIDRPVTVDQLEQLVAQNHGKPDSSVERLLYGLEVTERISAERLAKAEAGLPGPASKKALMAISDEAAFRNLPARDLPATAPLDHAAQLSLLAKVISYVNRTTQSMPNFFASRETTNFETQLLKRGDSPDQDFSRELWSSVGASKVTVYYRDGAEFKQNEEGKDMKDDSSQFMETNGEFGPILPVVLGDALHSKMGWSHWEQGPSGLMAVFRYSVAKELSNYSVFYPSISRNKQQATAYHGEIAVNPEDGSILRITLLALLNPTDQNAKANLLVEYGSVEIGNRNYICPVKSVDLSVVPVPSTSSLLASRTDPFHDSSRFRLRVNDVRFTHYHLFRAEIRILAGAAPEGASPSPGPDVEQVLEPAKPPQQ